MDKSIVSPFLTHGVYSFQRILYRKKLVTINVKNAVDYTFSYLFRILS